MKFSLISMLAMVTLMFTSMASAQDHDARLRLQMKHDRLSAVVESPRLSSPGSVLLGAGMAVVDRPRFDVNLHLGALTLPGRDATGVVDARGTVGVTDDVSLWLNARLLGLEDLDEVRLYAFGMADYRLPGVLRPLSVGVESENSLPTFSPDGSYDGDYSVGPNAFVHVNDKVRFEVAYQFHTEVRDQVWARVDVRL